MERPYIVCHILSALDGKIEGAYARTKAARAVSEEYARIREVMFPMGTLWQKIMRRFIIFRLIPRERSAGNPDSVTVFEKMDVLPDCGPVEFKLKQVERLQAFSHMALAGIIRSVRSMRESWRKKALLPTVSISAAEVPEAGVTVLRWKCLFLRNRMIWRRLCI